MQIGLVGAGSMGANHARVISESQLGQLLIHDIDHARAKELALRHDAQFAKTIEELLDCDAVVIAATTSCHVDLASLFIDARVPLLVEKPLAERYVDTVRLVEASRAAGTPLQCGFVERFNPALSTALGLINEPVVHVHAVRHSPRSPRPTASVVHDLLVHDLDLALRLNDDKTPIVTGALWAPKEGQLPEVADSVLRFGDGMVANLSASRWAQRKIREVRIATESTLFEIDLLRVNVTVYRNVRQFAKPGDSRDYRSETIIDVPYVRHRGEPLALQFAAFVDLVREQDAAQIEEARAQILPPHLAAATLEGTE